jgi:hypothetical protein
VLLNILSSRSRTVAHMKTGHPPAELIGNRTWRSPMSGFWSQCVYDMAMFSFVFNYVPCHTGVWRSGGKLHVFLISALDGGEWSALRPGRFTLGTQWVAWNSEAIRLTAM